MNKNSNHILRLVALVGCVLSTPLGLQAQQSDSLSVDEIFRSGRDTTTAAEPAVPDVLPLTSLRNRRLTALETFRNAGAGFDLEAWVASRRAFLQSVRERFGLDNVVLPSPNDHGTADTDVTAPETRTLTDRAAGEKSTEVPGDQGSAPAVVLDAATGHAPAPTTHDILLQMVDEATEREDLVLDLLVRLDARLERLERVAGTLPDGLSTAELRRFIQGHVPSLPKR